VKGFVWTHKIILDLRPSRRLKGMQSCRVISRVSIEFKSNVSDTVCASIIRVDISSEDGSIMLLRNVGIYLHIHTALQSRKHHRRENLKSHITIEFSMWSDIKRLNLLSPL
jgi:hypothetical protein